MRRRLQPWAYLGEPLLNPTPLLLLLLAAGQPMALAGIALKVSADLLLLSRLRGAAVPLQKAPSVVVKDLLVLAVWVVGAFRQTVCWRGNPFRVGRGSVLLPARPARAEARASLARDAAA
jgi:hypothetical protein